MPPAERLRAETTRIVRSYWQLLESAASPLIATPERWRQCRIQIEDILLECADRVDGQPPRTSAALQRTVEIGAKRAEERIPHTESIRAASFIWQASFPVIHETLSGDCSDSVDASSPLLTGLNALVQALFGRLLHGANGYNDPGIRHEILRDVSYPNQHRPFPPEHPVTNIAPLTMRELQVLSAAAKAMTNYEIGRELGITETTVKRHMSNIFSKLDATSRMDAIRKAKLETYPASATATKRKTHSESFLTSLGFPSCNVWIVSAR